MNQPIVASAYSTPNARRDPLYTSSAIAGKTVTLIGLGGGGEIAFHLLRSGVEKFNLIDFDTLDAGNLIRHTCGSDYVGWNKAEAVADLLRKYPETKPETIRAFDWNIFEHSQDFELLVAESDLVIVATDNDPSRFYTGEVCREYMKSAIFVSMFGLGRGGEVFISRPGGACYECFTHHQGRKEFLREYFASEKKSDCTSSRDVRSMPGLGIDQSFLCALAARKSLDILLSDSESALPPVYEKENWIIFSLFGIPRALEGHLSSLAYSLDRHNECGCLE